MKKLWLCAVLLAGASGARAQEEIPLDSLMQSAQQWAKENLDDDTLKALQDVDQEKVRQFLQEYQEQSHGEYVLDMAQLKDTAKAILPMLESYEETTPYAVWLKAHLDYLEVAGALRSATSPPRVKPGETPKPLPNPTADKERAAWTKQLAQRPWPKEAKTYVPKLKPIFASEHVPTQLVWLAEVESSFDRRARSPDGAVGLYQLTPATAKRYGLRTGLLDQRTNPEDNARAAAQLLKRLHEDFQDWRLALAAYNAGDGKVRRLLKAHNAHTFDAISSYLPAETQMYVPRFEAVLLRREGVKLEELPRG